MKNKDSQSEPLVTIVLPTLNGRRFIQQSIESCLTQTYTRFELLVVDGGSTDGTRELVQAMEDPRIRLIDQPANSGRLPGALNHGFAQAQGDFFTWTQDDDYYTPEALARMVTFLLDHPDVGFVYTGFWHIDEQGTILRESNTQEPEAMHRTNPIGHCFLYRRTVAEQVGEYDVGYFMVEDIEYWMRVYQQSSMAYLAGRFYYHRLHPASLTVSDYGRYLALRLAAKARRQHLALGWRAYQRQVAAAYIEEAFAAHKDGRSRRTLRCLLHGIVRNPAWLTNRGVWAIGWRSLR